MFIPNFLSLDFVSWWKAASILLTGFFGILGLVTEFKDQSTKKITKWGKLALTGVLVSTGFGIYSQLLETADQNKKRAEDAQQAFQLLRGNQRTLNEIERSLSLLDEPTVWAVFNVSCEGDVRPLKGEPAEDSRARTERMRRFCKAIEPFNGKSPRDGWPEQVWRLWPIAAQGYFSFSILVSRQSQAQALESELDAGVALVPLFGTPKTADWYMYFSAAHSPDSSKTMKLDRYSQLFGDHQIPRIAPLDAMKPLTNVNNGKLQSLMDLDDAYLYVLPDGMGSFRPDFIKLTFRNGRHLSFEADDFKLLGDTFPYFRAKIKIDR